LSKLEEIRDPRRYSKSKVRQFRGYIYSFNDIDGRYQAFI